MRRETRQPVSRPGRIELASGTTFSCRIADLSSGGALLILSNGEWLPKQFVLVDTFDGTKREVQIVWTAPDRLGVRFLGDNRPMAKKSTGFGKRR